MLLKFLFPILILCITVHYGQVDYLNLTGLTNTTSIASVPIGTTGETFSASITTIGSPGTPHVSSNGDFQYVMNTPIDQQCINFTFSSSAHLYITDHTAGKPPTYNINDSLSFSSTAFIFSDPSSLFNVYPSAIVPTALVSSYTGWSIIFLPNTSFQVCGQRIVGSPTNNFRLPVRFGVFVSNPLPIELMSFAAQLKGEKVAIHWETGSETNNDYFVIERSGNGLDWEEVSRVQGTGNVTSPRSYSLCDEMPLSGVSYYRLQQVDRDGKITYFDPVIVNVNLETDQVETYPVPTKEELTVLGEEWELSHFEVYNLLGQLMNERISIVEQSDSKLVLDLSTLPSGAYYLKTKTTVKKIYKQ
jgi:hypothetical protein